MNIITLLTINMISTIEPTACILGFMFGIETVRRSEPADMQTGLGLSSAGFRA